MQMAEFFAAKAIMTSSSMALIQVIVGNLLSAENISFTCVVAP